MRIKNPKRNRILKIFLNILIFSFLFLPLAMWLMWQFTPKKKMKIFIMDKTVLSTEGLEHRCFNWVLKHKKYLTEDGDFYNIEKDYFGFFPKENKKFIIKDLKNYSKKQVESICKLYDMAYYTDTYGMYYNEWYRDTLQTEHSEKLYGGLDESDYLFLKKLSEQKKLILAEFNFLADPTPPALRSKVEDLFGIKWTGWVGRYYASLDTLKNPELPIWLISKYRKQHNNAWPFKSSGIAFIHEDERVEILENKVHLSEETPTINTFPYGVDKFTLPKKLNYLYWFDIMQASDTNNHVVSYYEIKPTKKGDSILQKNNIPLIFPALFERQNDFPFYYMCGDFCDSPMNDRFVKFKGIGYFELFVQNENDYNNREPFFWRYYINLMNKILHDYYEKLPKK